MLIMLLLLLGQGVTGLFTNDDIMLEGPLTHLVSYDQSRTLTGIHETISWMLVAIVSLHVFAILFYGVVKKENLVKSMITGKKYALEKQAFSEGKNYWFRGSVLLGLCSGVVYAIINYL